MDTLEKTLVIIDMQDWFIKHQEERDLIPIICELIKQARQQRWAIILVEFYTCGPTNEIILEAVKDYPYTRTIIKSNHDGGKEIIECLGNHPAWSTDLLVCGIYGDECVPATVDGLLNNNNLVEVSVITDAIHPPYCSQPEWDGLGQQREYEIEMKEITI